MSAKIRAGLVGVTGYTGMELARILAFHPQISLTVATSRSEAGKAVRSLYPSLLGMEPGDITITEPDPAQLARECDVVFLAIPHGAAMEMGASLVEHGVRVVDLSADYRIRDKKTYEDWYKVEHTRPEYLSKAVYGLPELYGPQVAKAKLVANPGCYPTASILGLYPALKNKFIENDGIVIDAKSGATGAGRGAKVGMLYCEVADSFRPYGIGTHRHTPEIEQELADIAGIENMRISFNPHLLPINRGILATIYGAVRKKGLSVSDLRRVYLAEYGKHPFVRVLPEGQLPDLKNVRGTMFCDIGIVLDQRTGRVVILSAIDNLCRGASGQAVANANLMFGLPLATGLQFAPLAP